MPYIVDPLYNKGNLLSKVFIEMKILRLLSIISLCWQSITLAMEKEDKQTIAPAGPVEHQASTNPCLPMEIIDQIFFATYQANDRNTILTFMASCPRINAFGMQLFIEDNQAHRHYPWRDIDVSPSTLNILNNRLITILGLYVNMICHLGNDVDRLRFEKRCDSFLSPATFLENTLPVMYAQLLQAKLACLMPIDPQTSADDHLRILSERFDATVVPKLEDIADKQQSYLQNETALYFHYNHFLHYNPFLPSLGFDLWYDLQDTSLFQELDNSFMDVMNLELIECKRAYRRSHDPDKRLKNIWYVFGLEPEVITIKMISSAADDIRSIVHADDDDNKIEKIELLNKAIVKFLYELGDRAAAHKYSLIAHVYP